MAAAALAASGAAAAAGSAAAPDLGSCATMTLSYDLENRMVLKEPLRVYYMHTLTK